MDAISKYYNNAPPLAKNAMVLLAVGVTGLAFWEIYKAYQSKKRDDDANAAKRAADKDIEVLEDSGGRRSLSDSQIDSMITSITTALTGCGTDEEAVYNTFKKIRTDLDFLYLISRFGVQYYQPCSITSPISFAKWLADPKSFPGDLPTWLNYDLSQSEIGKVNQILQQNGISYSF